ncbi:signal peptidase I [Candidatus Margulisiibacteriota bacterium]
MSEPLQPSSNLEKAQKIEAPITYPYIYSETELSNLVENCSAIEPELRTIRGSSMSGVAEAGDIVDIYFGYYSCYPVTRNDLIIYKHPAHKTPIFKMVKGVPGDSFALQKNNNVWNIMLNGEVLRNNKGNPYIMRGNRHKMLEIYVNDFKGLIPPTAYLVLGNTPSGSLDSTRFGLIDKKNFIGKVVRVIHQ